jgi:hypothetical protein
VTFAKQSFDSKDVHKNMQMGDTPLLRRILLGLSLTRYLLEKRLTMLVIALIFAGCAITYAQFIRWQTAWVAALYSRPAVSLVHAE